MTDTVNYGRNKFYGTGPTFCRSLTYRRGRESQEPSSQLVKMMEGQLTLANLPYLRHPFIPKRRSLVEADSDEKSVFLLQKLLKKWSVLVLAFILMSGSLYI
jgi:hypothetical protein